MDEVTRLRKELTEVLLLMRLVAAQAWAEGKRARRRDENPYEEAR